MDSTKKRNLLCDKLHECFVSLEEGSLKKIKTVKFVSKIKQTESKLIKFLTRFCGGVFMKQKHGYYVTVKLS